MQSGSKLTFGLAKMVPSIDASLTSIPNILG
jgi:hypothetical protein